MKWFFLFFFLEEKYEEMWGKYKVKVIVFILCLLKKKKKKKNDKWYWFYKDLMIIQVLEYCIILHIIIQSIFFWK